MKGIQQLIKKNSQEGKYEDIFPKTFIDAVLDKESGVTLTDILAMFNMLFLSYNGSRSQTRLQVPSSFRRKGLWVTYVLYDKTVVTEWYNAEAIDDTTFGDSANWRDSSNALVGDISTSSDGYWVINGEVTNIKVQGEAGITPILRVGSNNHLQVSYTNGSSYVDVSSNPVFTQFRVSNNKLQQSTDLGESWSNISEELAYKFRESGNKIQMSKDLGSTWQDVSDYIAAWFKFTGTTGSSQADNVGKIQISRDNGATWSDLSGEFTNSLHIKGYVATVGTLPSTAVQGDIYGVGPTYDPSDTEHTNPIYQLYVKNSTGWVNNGRFTSIAAGVVQELGDNENAVVSQKVVTENFKISSFALGVQSNVSTITFEDKEDKSVDVVFNDIVNVIQNNHKQIRIEFDSYPTRFNVPQYKTLCLDLATKTVSVQNLGDGVYTYNNLILLHKEPEGVNNGVLSLLYNIRNDIAQRQLLSEHIEQYIGIDKGGTAISPLTNISLIKKEDGTITARFKARTYYIINDYINTPGFTVSEDTDFNIPNNGALIANVKTRKIEVADGYYERDDKHILLAYQEGGIIYNGLLKGLYDRIFVETPFEDSKNLTELKYSKLIRNRWVNTENVETYDTNFDLYYFDVQNRTKVQLYVATGGGYIIFLDSENNVLSSYKHPNNTYLTHWVELNVPNKAVLLKVSHAITTETHPLAYPLLTLADRGQVEPENQELNLAGKKVVFFGDSITEMGYYVDAFQYLTGCSVVNRGASGTCITKTEGRGYDDSLSERIDLPPSDAVGHKLGLPENADLVILFAGVNDWGQRDAWKINLGTMEAEIDKTNFTGATRYVCSKLREKYPKTPIVVLSMLHVYHPESFKNWAEIQYNNGQFGGGFSYIKDEEGNTMDVWRNRVREVAKFYGIAFVDITHCGFTPFLQSDNEAFMPDGLHPSKEGGEILAQYIISQLKSLFIFD